MYIIRNALKCIGRSKGRNILIGIIVLVIAVSACIGLSIRQAAHSAKEENLSGMTVTATISIDRQAMMGNMGGLRGGMGGFMMGKRDMNSGDFSIVGYSSDSAMTSFIDGDTQDEIMQIFRTLADQGKCVILVSHSPQVASMCDETYELKPQTKGKK